MRWKERSRPRQWDERIVSAFLYIPVKLDGEWRWLEKATWQEMYGFRGWVEMAWLD